LLVARGGHLPPGFSFCNLLRIQWPNADDRSASNSGAGLDPFRTPDRKGSEPDSNAKFSWGRGALLSFPRFRRPTGGQVELNIFDGAGPCGTGKRGPKIPFGVKKTGRQNSWPSAGADSLRRPAALFGRSISTDFIPQVRNRGPLHAAAGNLCGQLQREDPPNGRVSCVTPQNWDPGARNPGGEIEAITKDAPQGRGQRQLRRFWPKKKR